MAVTLRSVKGSALSATEIDVNFRSYPQILACSAVPASYTGATAETTIATITVPGGSMGPNGALRITTLWTTTNSAGTKTGRVKFNGTAYTTFQHTTSVGAQLLTVIRNRNSQSSQVGAGNNLYYSAGGTAHPTSTHDTSGNLDITITGQHSNGADTITIDSYIVEVFYGA